MRAARSRHSAAPRCRRGCGAPRWKVPAPGMLRAGGWDRGFRDVTLTQYLWGQFGIAPRSLKPRSHLHPITTAGDSLASFLSCPHAIGAGNRCPNPTVLLWV